MKIREFFKVILILIFFLQVCTFADPSEKALKDFRNSKFGIFVHWNFVALTGHEIGWSRGGKRPGVDMDYKGPTPPDVYDSLYKKWNPEKFDAENWVNIFKNAGARYMVFTTKHLGGFSLWDSKYTDYKITNPNSPYKKDIVKQIANACDENDFGLGLYYSPADFRHPDYDTEKHLDYIKFFHDQVRELMSNYGDIDYLWLDSISVTPPELNDKISKMAEKLEKDVRELQPDIMITGRYKYIEGDYETPEQQVGKFDRSIPWETCMTLGEHWAWKPDENLKSAETVIKKLIYCASGDGNLLLNVGPKANGRIEPDQVEILKKVGTWLKTACPSIYGTRGGPFKPDHWIGSTCRGNEIYLHILNFKGKEYFILPGIDADILKAENLTGNTVAVEQTDELIKIIVPESQQSQLDTIIKLTIDKNALDIPLLSVAEGPFKPESSYSSTCQDIEDWAGTRQAQEAFDDTFYSLWISEPNDKTPRLKADFKKPVQADAVFLQLEYLNYETFKLDIKTGEKWNNVFTGSPEPEMLIEFEPNSIEAIRFKVHNAKGKVGMREMKIYNTFKSAEK